MSGWIDHRRGEDARIDTQKLALRAGHALPIDMETYGLLREATTWATHHATGNAAHEEVFMVLMEAADGVAAAENHVIPNDGGGS